MKYSLYLLQTFGRLHPFLTALCCVLAIGGFSSAGLAADPWPEITAESAIVADAETGQILFEKAPDAKAFPASLTKMLTALILLEKGQQNQWVTIPTELPRLSGSTIGLRAGDVLSTADLATAILVASGNDAALTAACYLAGNADEFAQTMNQKASSLGLKNSHFVNPHGLHHPDHYSTAHDLTLLASIALENREFRRLVATQKASVTILSKQGSREVAVETSNKLLGTYPGCDGVKSGFTLQAGRCVIASATRDGWQVIATVLKSKDAFQDATNLLDYVFQNLKALQLAEAGKPLAFFAVSKGASRRVAAVAAEDLRLIVENEVRLETTLLPNVSPLRAPIKAGEQVGTFIARFDGEQAASVSLLAGRDVPPSRFPTALWDPKLLLACVLLVLAVFLGFLAARRRYPAP